MKNLERIYKALANSRRLAIIKFLKKAKEAIVGDIADKIELSFKATSRHLRVLAHADILDKEQRGLEVYYKIASNLPSAARHLLSIL